MKVCILSGGSGNTKILKALYELGVNSSNIRIITNAYDNGKSTGVCRDVTDTLGVSDIRKNHFKIFSNELSNGLEVNNSDGLIKFYKERLNFKNKDDVRKYLTEWNLEFLAKYSDYFFSIPKASNYNYNDFSISNIVYSAMYKLFGYEYTNSFFCDLLGIDHDCVLLNSFDNAFLAANTLSGHVIGDEGDIVEWKNGEDKINDTLVEFKNKSLNSKAIYEILTCDLLIISSGTFWSSIYPTFQYADFYKFVNKSCATKLWFLNTKYDKDAYNVSSEEFISHMNHLGLCTEDITIIQNEDSEEENLKNASAVNIINKRLGNIDGTFNYKLVAKFLDDYVH